MDKEKLMKPVPIHRGMTFGFYARNGYFGLPEARQQVDKMKELNIEWICVVSTVLPVVSPKYRISIFLTPVGAVT